MVLIWMLRVNTNVSVKNIYTLHCYGTTLAVFTVSASSKFLVDGSADTGCIKTEIVKMMSCKNHKKAEEINLFVRYLAIEVPRRADANGLWNEYIRVCRNKRYC